MLKTDMKRTFVYLSLIISFSLALLVSGCGRVDLLETMSAEEQWEVAKEYFEREKYLDAIDLLTLFTLNFSGSTLIDSAQYLMAESHFVLQEYILAEAEYERLVQNFPQSPLVDDAWLKIILCNFYMAPRFDLDQKYTDKTVDAIRDFQDMYSGADIPVRLAAKPTTGQVMRSIFTLGIWKPRPARVAEVPLERTEVVYSHRSLGFGNWLLRVITFGLYDPGLPDLKTPSSTLVGGDWVVERALEESRSRLAQKAFKSGELYYRMKKYPSAIIYFDSVIEGYNDTPWAEHALKLKGDSYSAMKKYQDAVQAYELYLDLYGSDGRGDVESRLEECRFQLSTSLERTGTLSP
jgi:outer membrane protein assembly factor BamD (BamD/ComL family)